MRSVYRTDRSARKPMRWSVEKPTIRSISVPGNRPPKGHRIDARFLRRFLLTIARSERYL